MKRTLLLVLLLLLFVSLSSGQPIEGVPLASQNGRLYAPVVLTDATGQEHTVAMLVDTGTASSFLSTTHIPGATWQYLKGTAQNFSTHWKIQTIWGSLETSQMAIIEKLQVGTKEFSSCHMLDVSHLPGQLPPGVLTKGAQWLPIVGILGADILFSSSLYLSISQGVLAWIDWAPWKEYRAMELVPVTGGRWAIPARFPGIEGQQNFLVDTGSFPDVVPQGYIAKMSRDKPFRWLEIEELAPGDLNPGQVPTSRTMGIIDWQTILDDQGKSLHHIWALESFGDATLCLFGNGALAKNDLWFEIQPLNSARLLLHPSETVAAAQFTNSIDYASWDFPETIRGLVIDSPTQNVIGLMKWGDGVPLISGLAIGDTLISMGGKVLSPGDTNYPTSQDPTEFRWRRPDGSEFSCLVTKKPVFPLVP